MPETAFRYRWDKPREGVAVFELRWRMGGLRPKPVNPPRQVVAPKRLDAWEHEVVEPTAKSRVELVRALEVLDPDDTPALIAYLSRWGFLQGSPLIRSTAAAQRFPYRFEHDLAGCFSVPGAPPSRAPRMPKDAELVSYVRLASARRLVLTYQDAVARYADLPTLQEDDWRAKAEELRRIVLEQLALWTGVERDPETFLPLIESPLATAWQRLAETSAGGQFPRRCEHKPCRRPFSLAETDKRTDAPPRFCSPRCHLADWRARNRNPRTTKAPKRRGR